MKKSAAGRSWSAAPSATASPISTTKPLSENRCAPACPHALRATARTPSCSWIWTTSRNSTIPWGMWWAIWPWWTRPKPSAALSAPWTSWAALAGTNSAFFCRASPGRCCRPGPKPYWPPCASPTPARARRWTLPPASASTSSPATKAATRKPCNGRTPPSTTPRKPGKTATPSLTTWRTLKTSPPASTPFSRTRPPKAPPRPRRRPRPPRPTAENSSAPPRSR